MEENKNQELAQQQLEQEEKSAFDFQAIYSAIIPLTCDSIEYLII